MTDASKISLIKNARFTELFIQANDLGEDGFEEWILLPGMMFHAPDKWWGNQAKRNKPHEGLDLCLYRDRQGKIHYLNEGTQIPAMYEGIIVKILDDFLGKSVIMEHVLSDSENIFFFTIFGHTRPASSLRVGTSFNPGDIIASIAGAGKSNSDINPHLHISIGYSSQQISYENLNWQSIGTPNTILLFDPLTVMNLKYSELESNSLLFSEY